jgi:CheY-like chemotaxis protein
VVDDNRDAADSTAELLALCGARVEVRYAGEDAVVAAVEEPPDAVVLDLSMPGMDGFEVAERIRGAGNRPPLIVALTALEDYRTLEREVAAGFDLHFTKPVDAAELLDALKEHLDTLRDAGRSQPVAGQDEAS